MTSINRGCHGHDCMATELPVAAMFVNGSGRNE